MSEKKENIIKDKKDKNIDDKNEYKEFIPKNEKEKEKHNHLIYRKIKFFNFFNYMYDYSNIKKDRIPLNQIIKEFKFYYTNIEKITKNNDNDDNDNYDYNYIMNYSIKDLKNDLKNFININSRNYNKLPIDKQKSIQCYYDLDTIIDNQRGAICKIKHKKNIIIVDDKIIDTSISNSKS